MVNNMSPPEALPCSDPRPRSICDRPHVRRTGVAVTHDSHAAYAAKYNADFIVNREVNSTTWQGTPRNINFRKLEIMIEMVEKYQKVLYLDADAMIVRDDFDIFTAAGYGIAIPRDLGEHADRQDAHQRGRWSLNSSPEVKEFLHEWNKSPGGESYKGEYPMARSGRYEPHDGRSEMARPSHHPP